MTILPNGLRVRLGIGTFTIIDHHRTIDSNDDLVGVLYFVSDGKGKTLKISHERAHSKIDVDLSVQGVATCGEHELGYMIEGDTVHLYPSTNANRDAVKLISEIIYQRFLPGDPL